jgi:molybdopterin molybdotransferase
MSQQRLTRAAATREILILRDALVGGLDTETVPLARLDGRVLASPVTAEREVPAAARTTMDGFAVAAADGTPRSIRSERVGPGDDPPDHQPGTATRVATGASLPRGADAVVPVEDAVGDDDRLTATVRSGQHVVGRGSVVAAGETVLPAGRRLAPRDAALLADLGREDVPVRRRLSVALLATGTEIAEGREPDRDSPFLANLVRSWGGDPVLAGSVPDDPDRVSERVAALASDHDVVVTTGGTGVASADETGDVLRERATVHVSNVAMRPGSNVTVARLDDGTVVMSLPGVPGAAFASATLLLRPLFAGEATLPSVARRLDTSLAVPGQEVEFVVPVEVGGGDEPTAPGAPARERTAVPFGHEASSVDLYEGRFRPHRVASCVKLSAADGFVLTRSDLEAGERVAVAPYRAVES